MKGVKTEVNTTDYRCVEPNSTAFADARILHVAPASATQDDAGYDVGDIVSGKCKLSNLPDAMKFNYLKRHFRPGKGFNILQDTVKRGNDKKPKALKFQLSWLDMYPWLVYSPSLQEGPRKFCVIFGTRFSRGRESGVLVQKSMTKLRKALGKDGTLSIHDRCTYHSDAVARGNAFISSHECPSARIDSQLAKVSNVQATQNCHVLEKIVDTILFLGRQGIPLRVGTGMTRWISLKSSATTETTLWHSWNCRPRQTRC